MNLVLMENCETSLHARQPYFKGNWAQKSSQLRDYVMCQIVSTPVDPCWLADIQPSFSLLTSVATRQWFGI